MTEKQLVGIEARANAATPGPWLPPQPVPNSPLVTNVPQLDHEGCAVWPWSCKEDMIFAYAARMDVPALIAEVRGLRDALSKLTAEATVTANTIRRLLEARVTDGEQPPDTAPVRLLDAINAAKAALDAK